MIVFLGDSLTQEWDLGAIAAGGPLINAGVAGEVTAQMGVRWLRDHAPRRPSGLHLFGGINDIAGNAGPVSVEAIWSNLLSIIRSAQSHGTVVVVGTLLPCLRIPWREDIDPHPQVMSLNAHIRSFADYEPAVLVADYFAAFADASDRPRPALFQDGLHLNGAGYALLTSVVQPILDRARRR